MDRYSFHERDGGEKSNNRIEKTGNWISNDCSIRTFNLYFTRESARSRDRQKLGVTLVSARFHPRRLHASRPRDRSIEIRSHLRSSPIIERRSGIPATLPRFPKLNSHSRFISSRRHSRSRQLQIPNFIFRVFGHREVDHSLIFDRGEKSQVLYAF